MGHKQIKCAHPEPMPAYRAPDATRGMQNLNASLVAASSPDVVGAGEPGGGRLGAACAGESHRDVVHARRRWIIHQLHLTACMHQNMFMMRALLGEGWEELCYSRQPLPALGSTG